MAAHIAAGRYEHLVLSFRVTAQRLDSLRNRWIDRYGDGEGPPEERTRFVESCEAAISVENQGWMAGYLRHLEERAPVETNGAVSPKHPGGSSEGD